MKNKQSGASYVEMALSILIFITLIIAILELLLFSFVNASMQFIMAETMRAAAISYYTDLSNSNCNSSNRKWLNTALQDSTVRAECIEEYAIKKAASLGFSVSSDDIIVQGLDTDFSYYNVIGTTPSDPCAIPAGYQENAGPAGGFVSVCILTPETPVVFGIKASLRNFSFARNELFKYR